MSKDEIQDLIDIAIKAERERLASILENSTAQLSYYTKDFDWEETIYKIVKEIRKE